MMITLPPQLNIPILAAQMERTTLGKLSRTNSMSLNIFYAIPLCGSKEDWFNKWLRPWAGFSHGEPTYTDVLKDLLQPS
ncbi:hypothetical protein HD554DRAFT_1764536 [Boletus coccyginus]|nr:hypothetical protein HD554DRAFT_1764536 [Boletus coccyginus]